MQLISKTMKYYLLKGQRNLGLDKSKVVAKATKTDVMVWIDPARWPERKAAWESAFNGHQKKRRAK